MTKDKKPDRKHLEQKSDMNWFKNLSSGRKDFLSILFLYLLVLVLFNRILFSNMIFSDSGDTAAAQSWAQAGKYLEEQEKIEPQWFPFVFSGMPSFGSLAYGPRDVSYLQHLVHLAGKLLFINAEMSWLVLHYFLAGLFMFFLLRFEGFRHAPSLVGAITFAFSPYAVGLAGGGHGSKLMALSYLPLVFLFTDALFRRRNLLSLGLFSAALGTLFLTGHVQMVFYVLLVVGLYSLYEIIQDLRIEAPLAVRKAGLFTTGLAIGFAISAFVYLSVQEYAPFSIRGGGEAGASGGLTYDYATNWSFHPFEIMNFLLPSFFGFRTPYYWGWMPFTESSVYIGLVPLILGAVALLYNRTRMTIFLAILSVVIFVLSFGKHFPILYDLLFNYLPYFNKFRSPSMILHLIPFTFGFLTAYGMSFLLEISNHEKGINVAKLKKGLLVTLVIIGVILVIGFLAGSVLYDSLSGFMFEKEGQLEQIRAQYGQQAQQVLQQLKKTRFDLFWNGSEIPGVGYIWHGYVRFALFAGAALGLILLCLNRKVKAGTFSVAMVALLAIDLLIIDGDFIHPKPNTALKQQFQPDETIRFLKADSSLYRILPLGQELFQDNTYMYHLIRSVGGYSPAKLKIYQEVLDSCLFRGWEKDFPLNMNVLNMLNTKYVLSLGRLPEDKFQLVHVDRAKSLVTSLNPNYLPRAFFVGEVIVATNKAEILGLLDSPTFNPRHQAILEKTPSPMPLKPDTSSAEVTKFHAHEIIIETFSNNTSLLVLSEVYYPKGWRAYVDEKETETYKTNYILRSVIVPEGKHTIVFRYHSTTYDQGLLISSIGWGMSLLLIIVGAAPHLWKKKDSVFRWKKKN